MKPSYKRTTVSHNSSKSSNPASSSSQLSCCTYSEFHGLGTGSPQLSRNNDLATLGTRLHDKPQDTIARTTDSKPVKEFVAKRLALGNCTKTAVLNLGSVERDRVFGELETFLNERSELTDAAPLLSENLLGVGSTDDYEMSVSSSPLSRFSTSIWAMKLREKNILISVTVGVTRTSTPE